MVHSQCYVTSYCLMLSYILFQSYCKGMFDRAPLSVSLIVILVGEQGGEQMGSDSGGD